MILLISLKICKLSWINDCIYLSYTSKIHKTTHHINHKLTASKFSDVNFSVFFFLFLRNSIAYRIHLVRCIHERNFENWTPIEMVYFGLFSLIKVVVATIFAFYYLLYNSLAYFRIFRHLNYLSASKIHVFPVFFFKTFIQSQLSTNCIALALCEAKKSKSKKMKCYHDTIR